MSSDRHSEQEGSTPKENLPPSSAGDQRPADKANEEPLEAELVPPGHDSEDVPSPGHSGIHSGIHSDTTSAGSGIPGDSENAADDDVAQQLAPATPVGPVPAAPEANGSNAADEHDTSGLELPNRLHPTSWAFDILTQIRRNLIPAIFAFISASRGGAIGLGIAFLIFVPMVVYTLIRFLTIRYQIREGELIVEQGLIWRNYRSVPVGRIQNVDLTQNVFHRILHVAEVRIETASGKEPEATLRVLSVDRVEQLRQAIFKWQRRVSHTAQPVDAANAVAGDSVGGDGELGIGTPGPTVGSAPGETPDEEVLHTITPGLLVKAGLASNRGMLIVGVLVGLFFQFELHEQIDIDRLIALVPDDWGAWTLSVAVLIAAVTCLVVLRLVGVAWHILRFFDYRLVRQGDDLRISCGLLTRVSATVPRRRIQFISIHRPLFYRWLKVASIRIETAGGAGSANEDASATVSRRWFVPVIDEDQVHRITSELRPGLHWNDEAFEWQGLAPGAARRLCRIAVIQCLLISAGGYAVGLAPFLLNPLAGALTGVVVLPGMLVWAVRKSRAIRYGRSDFGVSYRSGVFNRKTSITFFDKIQTLQASSNFFDRRWDMARLLVDTAGAGPAEHRIHLELMDAAFVAQEFRRLQELAASHEPVWN